MRYRSTLPGLMASGVAAAVALAGLTTPAMAAPQPRSTAKTSPAATAPAAATSARALSPLGRTATRSDQAAEQHGKLTAAQLRPQLPATPVPASHAGVRLKSATRSAAAVSCTPADFGSRSGSALVSFVEGSTTDCVNTLFTVTGTDAANTFAEPQMVAIANALSSAATSYPGDDSTGVWQLVLFLRAGYYVQYNNASTVGNYDATLATATEGGLDAFFANAHSRDVTSSNGDVLGDVVTLTDSANEQARYLGVYQQLLNGYNSSYDAVDSMVAAVNNVYTPLFRGHQNPDFVTAVTADPSIITTLDSFANNHLDLLGTANSFLDSNAGIETSRFIQHPALQATVKPLMQGLLKVSSMTGPTAPLWVGVAGLADTYDQANCSDYGTCNLVAQLTAAALPITHVCDAAHTILAQSLSAADLDAACTSVIHQDAFFNNLVKDNGTPIPGEYESTVKLVVFASPTDYETYAGVLYNIDTNNGGMTLTGDPTDPNNQPMSIMYVKSADDGFPAGIWNLNHEYTHDLDGRYDTKGDFASEVTVPDVWWIEGLAEYVSYTYRGVTDTEAVAEAAKHTYALSTLWQSTYDNSDVTRTYPWGYLAVRYMFEQHPQDVYNMLAKFRAGDYAGGYAVYNDGIGTRYDADFNSWLTACAAGACSTPTPPPTLPQCTSSDPRELGQNCSLLDQSAAAGNTDDLYIYLPAGTTTLNVTTTGGTGNAYLYYSPDTWATADNQTAASTGSGNDQSITVTNTTAGYRYISLYANTAFSGVTVSAQY
ncbi:microbial collagenase [Kitasatospora sp. MAP12-15]|uniref:collagenase n=1 Tax=unclassified Kitasatospora TaxID=2633591 RepID=UPI00247723D2|nr:collagenase [Kitasatospora sp. MAP12-44]MDH6108622.1 microbial collagenase [Kitasatospora sp. MAP12-44]